MKNDAEESSKTGRSEVGRSMLKEVKCVFDAKEEEFEDEMSQFPDEEKESLPIEFTEESDFPLVDASEG